MPKPIPGQPYTIVKGDNLSKIAKRAYGDPKKWRLIYETNQDNLKSGDPNLIYPGEILWIPRETIPEEVTTELNQPTADETLSGADPNGFTLIVDGQEIPVQSARVIRTMDTIADAWTAEVYFDPANERHQKLFRPYQYNDALCYVGGNLVVRGKLYIVRPSITSARISLGLEGFSATADIIDSVVRPPYEVSKVTLKQRAEELLEPFGVPVSFEDEAEEPFDKVTAQSTDTIFDHLASLAKQRSILISSDIRGNVVFYRAKYTLPVDILAEQIPPTQSLTATFDGRKRFNSYRVIGPTPKKKGGNGLEAFAKDDNVPTSRFTTLSVNDATGGNIQEVADWQRSKQVADAMTIPFPVASWYTSTGELWREGTIVTVVSDTLFVPNGFDFLIKSVEYNFDINGPTAILSLVPPEVYTGEPIKEPWFD